ncbi:PAS domain S-box protein [Azospira restricta]|uniref:histidine kinase n=1 Tax=Azospira restricta TaxID=404405 RepID=A0A974SR22_9RHOO|nr:PAS domain S-box protein [Azospira restricta]QRJ64928.1 PAS domain S-box protein [Azospira restricta]
MRPGRSSWTFPVAVFALSAGMTIGIHQYERHADALTWQANLSREAAQVSSELRDRLRMHAQLLRAVRAFQETRAAGDDSWQNFARRLPLERPLQDIRAYGIALLAADGKALPVRHVAAGDGRHGAGADLLAEPRQAEAIELARDRDDVVVSRRIEFAGATEAAPREPGVLMVLPLYRPGAPQGTVAERRRAFAGVVFAAFRMRDFVHSLSRADAGALALRILDEDSFNLAADGQSLSLLYDSGTMADGGFGETREFEFGQRNWHLRFSARSNAGERRDTPALLLFGLLISALLALASRAQVGHRERAERRAQEIGRELRQSEERFKLAAEGANDGIWDRNLEDGTVWHSDRLKAILGFPEEVATASVDFFLSRVHADDRPLLEQALERHLRDRQPYSVDYRFRKGDGEWAWFRSRGQGVWNSDGRAVRLVGSIADVTAQKSAEGEVARYRDFLATVLKFIPQPVFVKNRRREYIAVNAAFCALVDLAEEDILGRIEIWREPLPAGLAGHIREMDERVLAGGGEQVEEQELPMRTGRRIVIARKTLATGPDGEPIVIGTLTDVTELRRAERERIAADRQRKAILDAATEVSIIATDRDGLITVFNRGAEKMLGYCAEEMVGRTTPERIHLPHEVAERGRFLSAELGKPVSGFAVFVTLAGIHGAEQHEWTYVRKDGSQLAVSLVVTAMRDENGELTGYLGIATDVSERQRALAELERQRVRMETIIEHIPGGVSLIDQELNFIAANRELKTVLELPETLFAAGPPSLYAVALFNSRRGEYGPGDPQALAMQLVERARHPVAHVFERTRPNGRTIEVRGTPLPDGGFVTIYTDVTERKRAEAELLRHRDHLQELVDEQTVDLRRAKEAAEAANEAKSEFLANMSHELRTPLHSILSFAALGGERAAVAAEDKLAHYFQRIRDSGGRLLSLVNDLLDLSKLEAGMMRIDATTHDVLPLLNEVIAELEPLAATRALRFSVASAATATTAFVDPGRIAQVLRNLLSNAIKFSPDGGTVDIAIADARLASGRRAGDAHDLAALQIEVRDHGVGIPEAELELVFEKFVQSSATSTGAGGTGLGLPICREIVRAHRGTIRACNNPRGGASLIVTLPREAPAFP